ncbi:Exopolysaccharide biosynthesis protein [Clostridium cavendishii DSM 21758]|uniref:Exopolysaccharide biosynthesis protein n=1 Tax=Clostridium cavendishii DSM 21758 TaxID=1121302 RepID=A0A1M6V5S6_9CLOT|nr:phosphodiester glycosidase family protein [Clostridium cavendishii]SHK76810.1 Exopolysaccharide biosynthesis protein [Clostridium cavendishii DSM 21758]
MKTHYKISRSIITAMIVLVLALVFSECGFKKKTVLLEGGEVEVSDVKKQSKQEGDIKKIEVKNKRFTGNILEIKDPKSLKIGYAQKGDTVKNLAALCGADVAINGGVFKEEGGVVTPFGSLIVKGSIENEDDTKRGVAAINENGELIVGNYSTGDLKKLKAVNAVSGNIVLVSNGVGQINNVEDNAVNSRTAIGQKSDGSIMLLVIDGGQQTTVGASLKDVQDTMLEHGVKNAINLDGGASSTMYYKGEIINKPSNGERKISNIIYVKQ